VKEDVMADLLKMTGINKQFPGVKALQDVSLMIAPSEVHGLIGENGAGKSTLIKIIAGVYPQDSGTIELDGRPVQIESPQRAQQLGIVTIYQEFNLVPSLTIAENIFIGREPKRAGFLDWGALMRQTQSLLERLGLELSAKQMVRSLSVAEQQMVEIARALSMQSRLIIMDEPTSALSEGEVERLFRIIRDLKAQGISIIFVSHRLEEVKHICDRITVLRDGRNVDTAKVQDVTIDDIIRMMVGRAVDDLFHRSKGTQIGEVVMRVSGLSRHSDAQATHVRSLDNISFEVRRGEILGLAGLMGAGRTEVARAIFGADPIDSGSIMIEGQRVVIRSPEDAIRGGIGLVPEDRKQQGIFRAMAVRENLTIAALKQLSRALGFVQFHEERRLMEEYRSALKIRMSSPEQRIANLSGGNQQKVIIARWMALKPKVLIVDEPTRGIDIAAKAEVHLLLDQMAQQGIAVIMISSELPEILGMSDRIITMCAGRITGEVMRADATEEYLMQLMTMNTAAQVG
jgi:inositol transport system ATP-binding protein